MRALALALLSAVSLSACDGSAGDGRFEDEGPVAPVAVRGDPTLDRGSDGYRVSAVRERFDGVETIRRYAYDAGGRILVDSVERNGEIDSLVTYEYDDGGRLLTVIEDDEDVVTYRYAEGRVRVVESVDDYREYRHDAAGRLSGLSSSFVDTGPGSPPGGRRILESEFALSYRDGLLDAVVETDPNDGGRVVTRYEYDAGLLTREVTTPEGFEASTRSLSLTRDANGRLTAVTRLRASVPQLETTFAYADDRLVGARTVPLVPPRDGDRTIDTRYEYSAIGLIERVTETSVEDVTGEIRTTVSVYDHESEPCVAAAAPSPEFVLLGEVIEILRPVSTALDCAYWSRP